jgi:transcription elongation factor GreA
MSEKQLSRATYDRLTAEYLDLTTRWRIEIAQTIERARELGDLSENGDYHAAKDEQGMKEGRIRQLKSILEKASIVEDLPAGVVGAGTIVTIVYEGDDDDMSERYLVGHIEERTGALDVVSPDSPMGIALLGSKEGTTVSYKAPGGELKVKILTVEKA